MRRSDNKIRNFKNRLSVESVARQRKMLKKHKSSRTQETLKRKSSLRSAFWRKRHSMAMQKSRKLSHVL